jgi:RNA polymerase sigma-70 factor (ECF subfamily)
MDPSDPDSLPLADLAALGQLFTEHEPALRAMLERRIDPAVGARFDASDVLGDAFLMARRKWPTFAASGMTPYAWLYGIARDCLIEAWRRENRACRDVGREMPWPERSSVQLGLSLVSPGTGPGSAAARAELQDRMRETLKLLGPADQEVLWMRHFDALSFAEIAAVLGVSENAATVRELRARRRLKDLWQTIHGDPP